MAGAHRRMLGAGAILVAPRGRTACGGCWALVLVACSTFTESTPVDPDGGAGAGNDGAIGSSGDAGVEAAAVDSGAHPPTAYTAMVLSDGPLLYFRMEDPQGTTLVHDESPNANHANVWPGSGAFPNFGAPGADGNAIVFGGQTGQRLEVIQKGFDFDGVQPFTLEAWFDIGSADPTYRHFFTKDTKAQDATRQEYGVFLQSDRGLVFERIVDGVGIAIDYPASTADGTWHYFAAVFDGAQMLFYVDGKTPLKKGDTRQAKPKDQPLVIGARGTTYGTMKGTLDEVAVYAKALGPERIAAHFSARK